jgi:hypothetical protein
MVARQRERTDLGRAARFACSTQGIAATGERQEFPGSVRQGAVDTSDWRASTLAESSR